MMIPVQEAIAWLAAPAGFMLVAAAIAAALMRSIFAMAIFVLVASVAAGTGALALGAPLVALAAVVVGGFAFVMFAGTILLTARAARARRLLGLAPGAALAILIAGGLIWAAPDIGRDALASAPNPGAASASRNEVRKKGPSSTNPPAQSEALLLGALALAGGLSVYGLLGFGERAAFAQRRDRRR
jgi:hypothetical protein